MSTTIYAAFPGSTAAAAAVRSLRATPDHVRLTVHRGQLESEHLPVAQTSGRRRALMGAVLGMLMGTAVALVAGALGVTVAPLAMSVAFAAFVGAGAGVLGGALTGVSSPAPALDRLHDELAAASVVLTIEADSADAMLRAEAVLTAHGAHIER